MERHHRSIQIVNVGTVGLSAPWPGVAHSGRSTTGNSGMRNESAHMCLLLHLP